MKARAGWPKLFFALGLFVVFFCCNTRSVPAQDEVPQALKILTDKLPDGKIGKIYEKELDAQGGKRPYIFSATGLPDGLEIRNFSDRISGQPSKPGTYSVTITLTDAEDPAKMTSTTLQLVVGGQ